MNRKRITVVVGAGAVLDFDFSYEGAVFPSCDNITQIVKDLTVDGLDVDRSKIIETVYDIITKKLNGIYEKRGLKGLHYSINFEELYFVLESMLTQGVEYLMPSACPPLSLIEEPILELRDFPGVEVARSLYAIIGKIIEIIQLYDEHFKNCDNSELWYREFWKNDEKSNLDIFTFNYDTTIENSIGEIEDGFLRIEKEEDFESFLPSKLLRNSRKLSTVHHLHGCINYAESAPMARRLTHSNRDMFKYESVLEAQKYLGQQQKAENQAKEEFVNSPILIGLRKLDKMTSLPSSVYYANLVTSLQKNKGLLIVGYSFGDLYVNQLLQKRLLMHGCRHRMVIIDYFPEWVNSGTAFRHFLFDQNVKMYGFLKSFIDLSFDESFRLKGIEFYSRDEPIFSQDHRCMFFICGFKKAVELHKDLIYGFLDGKNVQSQNHNFDSSI